MRHCKVQGVLRFEAADGHTRESQQSRADICARHGRKVRPFNTRPMVDQKPARAKMVRCAWSCGCEPGTDRYVVRIRRDFIGRGDWIRTSDPLLPKQMRYQAALRPDTASPLSLLHSRTADVTCRRQSHRRHMARSARRAVGTVQSCPGEVRENIPRTFAEIRGTHPGAWEHRGNAIQCATRRMTSSTPASVLRRNAEQPAASASSRTPGSS